MYTAISMVILCDVTDRLVLAPLYPSKRSVMRFRVIDTLYQIPEKKINLKLQYECIHTCYMIGNFILGLLADHDLQVVVISDFRDRLKVQRMFTCFH